MRRRISRLRILAISSIVWFSIVLSVGIVVSNDFFRESKDDILKFVNEQIPVKLYVDDIKLVFPFNIHFNKIIVGTKDSKDEFLYMDNLQLMLNPLHYFVRKDIYDILYYISSRDVTFYTRYFDVDDIQKYVEPTEDKDTDAIALVNEVLNILENKSVAFNNFTLKYDKEAPLDNFNLSLETLNAYFTDKRYILSSTLNLPDNTELYIRLDSSKSLPIESKANQFLNIEQAKLNLKAVDKSGELFDCNLELSLNEYDLDLLLSSKRDTRVSASSLVDSKDEEILKASYNIENQKADFDLNNFVLTPKMFYKSIAIIDDIKNTDMVKIIPVGSIETSGEKFAEAMGYLNGFVYSRLDAKGSYDPEKPLYIDMSSRTKLRDLSLDFDLKFTNNIVISDRFILDVGEESDISAKFYIPIKDLYESKFSANVHDLNVGDYQASFDVALSSVFNRNNSAFSQLQIENVRLNQFFVSGESFDILVDKNTKKATIKNTNADDSIFAIDVFFRNPSNLSVAGRGLLPTTFINKLVGKNVIDPLVEVHATYSVSNVNSKNKNIKHNLDIYAERIIGLERIFDVSTTFENNQLLLNSFVFNPNSSVTIKASGKVYQSSKNIVAALDIDTPFGKYDPTAVISPVNDKVSIDVSTSDSVIRGVGDIGYDGSVNFNLETTERLSVNGVNLLANVSLQKEAESEDIDLNGHLDFHVANGNLSFNAQSDFTLVSNNTVMLTNISYQSLGYRMDGDGSISLGDVSADIKIDLKEIDNGEGAIYANAIVNGDNINAKIETKKMLISSVYANNKVDGYLSGGITVVGALNNPSVELRDVELTDFDFAIHRYHITIKGSYRDREAKIDDINIKKVGSLNSYLDANRSETIRIYDSVVSEKYQRVNVDIKNFFHLSTYDAKFKYEMEQDSGGINRYKIAGTGLKINSRSLPNFLTTATYDGSKINFATVGSHGLRGNVIVLNGSHILNVFYIYDNVELLNSYGEVRGGNVNVHLVSQNLGLEMFEIFNVIFKRIDTYKGDFTFPIGSKNYTLYTYISGPFSSLSVNGRFVGRGKVVSQYFDDVFDDTTVDLNFDGKVLNINQLTLVTKKDARGVQGVGKADFLNNTLENMQFDLTTTSKARKSLFRYRPENFLDADANFGIFTTEGLIKLELKFLGSIQNPSIVGDIYAERNDIKLTMPLVSNMYVTDIYGPAHRVYYNLKVHAISEVQVRYMLAGVFTLKDDSELVVKNNMVNGVELEADIDIERGTITYGQNTYSVDEGSIVFADGSLIDPIINLTSSTKKSYINNGISSSVTLHMNVVNTRLSSLVGTSGEMLENSPIRFYTSPQLGVYQTALLAGVNTSETSSLDSIANSSSSIDDDNMTAESQLKDIANSYMDLALRQYVLNSAERFIQKRIPFVDYVSIDTEIVKGLFFDDVSIFEDFNLNRAFAGTSISAGWYIGKNLLFKAGVTYDELGYVESSSSSIVSEVEYGFSPTLGFELPNLLPDFKLVNLGFEYNMNPFGENRGQDFSIKAWQRFNFF